MTDNFFLLLDLPFDPPLTDPVRLETALQQKQAEWSRLRNHPTKGTQAQHYLSLLPEIRRVMLNPTLRAAEAEAAKKIALQQKKQLFADLDNAIFLLSAKGTLWRSELLQLKKRFPNIPPAVIEKRITVPLIADPDTSITFKTLNNTTFKAINEALLQVGCNSLYEFLDIPPLSTLATLQTAIRQKTETLRQQPLKDAKASASGTLIGHCQHLFRDETARALYDASCQQAKLIQLDNAITVAAFSGKIHPATYPLLLDIAATIGLPPTQAKSYIFQYCMQHNWMIEIPTPPPPNNTLQPCGYCGTINTSEVTHCRECGYALQQTCPQCQTQNASAARICIACGFALGDMPAVNQWLRQISIAYTQGDLHKTHTLLQQIQSIWHNHPDLPHWQQRLEKRYATAEQLAQTFQQQIKQKQLYQAHATLQQLTLIHAQHPVLTQKNALEQMLTQVTQWIQQAQTATHETTCISACLRALDIANDCREAQHLLTRYPPQPPQKLSLNLSTQSIQLTWQPTVSKGEITYYLLRQLNRPPQHPNDGDCLTETIHPHFTDTTAIAGHIYFYAIYAQRGKIRSPQATYSSAALIPIEIKNLQTIPSDQRIELRWQSPPTAHHIEVWRKIGNVPTRRGEGELLNGIHPEGVTDTNVLNGHFYGYYILVLFQDTQGNHYPSNGTTTHARPTALPTPILDLHAQTLLNSENNGLDIYWTPPAQGSVLLFRQQTPPTPTSGTLIPTHALKQLGSPITIQRNGYTHLKENYQGILYLTPATVAGDIAIIGKTYCITTIQPIQHLRGTLRYQHLYLEWEFPPQTEKILITYRHDTTVQEPTDPLATKKEITRSEYELKQAFIIPHPHACTYYFTLFAIIQQGEKILYSQGKTLILQGQGTHKIHYAIHIKKNLFGKPTAATLRLHTPTHHLSLPPLKLIKQENIPPTQPTEGIYICELTNITIPKHTLHIPIPLTAITPNSYARLFFNNPEDAHYYRLIHTTQIKLSPN